MDTKTFLPPIPNLLDQWHRGRSIQRRLPPHRQWRGCMALALLVDHFDQHALAVGERVFLPNHALTWMVLRDITADHAPRFLDPHYVGGSFATRVKATLFHGMPRINFASQLAATWNFRYVPREERNAEPIPPYILNSARDHWEFAVLNQMSAQMTNWRSACYESSIPGPSRSESLVPARSWMPMPYLVCPSRNGSRLPAVRVPTPVSGTSWQCRLPQNSVGIFSCLAARLRRRPEPTDIWWDVTQCDSYLRANLESFIFPPLRMHTPNHLRRALPGDVELDAGIGELVASRNDAPKNSLVIHASYSSKVSTRWAVSRGANRARMLVRTA